MKLHQLTGTLVPKATRGMFMPMQQAYCIHCKQKQYMLDSKEVVFKNGTPALKGSCIKCHASIHLILPGKRSVGQAPEVINTQATSEPHVVVSDTAGITVKMGQLGAKV